MTQARRPYFYFILFIFIFTFIYDNMGSACSAVGERLAGRNSVAPICKTLLSKGKPLGPLNLIFLSLHHKVPESQALLSTLKGSSLVKKPLSFHTQLSVRAQVFLSSYFLDKDPM
jgi:hypothetical protein